MKYFNSENNSTAYDIKKTNTEGVVDFGQLIENVYYVIAKDVKVGNSKYFVAKPVMLTTGFEGEISINPQEFIGKITLNVSKMTINGSYVKGANLNVALIEYSDYNDTLSHTDKIQKAVAVGVTANTGKVVFDKVPSSYNYYAYVYVDSINKTTVFSNYLYVGKDDEREVNINVLESDLYDIKNNTQFKIYFYGYYNGIYDYHKVPNVKVVAVKQNDYLNYNLQNASVSTILKYAAATGKTNIEGRVTLPLRVMKDYIIFVYFDDVRKYWSYYSIYIGSQSTSLIEIEVNENSLGISK